MNSDAICYGPRVEGDKRKRVNFTIRDSLHELMVSMAEGVGAPGVTSWRAC